MDKIVGLFAVSQDFAFGNAGSLPWKCPEDLARFKQVTMGKTLLVGRKTFDDLPPLPGRELIVIGKGHHTIEEALKKCFEKQLSEVYVIGGSTLLDSMKHYLTHLDLTVIKQDFPDADTRSPMFGNIEWNILEGPTIIADGVYNVILEKKERF
ncbi:Dihydrofolate reductase [Ralstonia phage RSP15]|uniref:Dihydrofolate reductase n=1 Tax=Ralstonia phage RSP15 TaxID=1785960 RepID=UPI00074D3023|nr:Dihydrofolate reductase [Ralstonia phage RSP15]BAU40125.1 Dihydrofolate reductase [Ralstonia phage RSP15]